MSSGIVGHSSAMPPNGNGVLQIVHYDATVRRIEKMRQKATQGNAPAATPAVSAAPAPAPAPVAPQPVAPQPAAAPAPTAMNGTHAAPAAAPAAKPLPKIDIAELETFLVNFVVEQTGYPPEMVELDADLEADLGIDSIKKAQLFGEMAEHLDVQIEVSEDMSLDDFPTLRHVTDFLQKAASGAAPTAAATAPATPAPSTPAPVATAPATVVPAAAPAPAPVSQPAPQSAASNDAAAALAKLNLDELEPFLINFVVEQTGYPPEMVELDADLEADLGIDSIKKAQLFGELAEHLDVKVEISEDMSLDDFPTLRHVMDFLKNAAANAGQAAPAAAPQPAAPARAPAPVAASPVAVQTMAAQPAAPAPTPSAQPAQPAANGKQSAGDLSSAELEQFLVNFVVEQTGYPPEMVELDADLEADLGIDSIKKAQLFGELAENLDAKVEVSEDMSLDDFPTLRHVMDFLVSGKKPASV